MQGAVCAIMLPVMFLATRSCIQSLVKIGVAFDRRGTGLALTLEAAHSKSCPHTADTCRVVTA